MPDTPARLVGPVVLTGAAATIATVPASTTWLIRSIHVANASSNAVSFSMSIGTFAVGTAFFNALPIPGNGSVDWSGLLVVNTAEVIQAFGSLATQLAITISGVART